MTPTDELRALLDERGIEYTANDEEHVKETCWPYMGELMAAFAEYDNGTTRFACDTWCFTPEQAVAATVGAEPWEPSKEWKAWHESLKHDNPTSIREAVENILYEAIDFGGDMGPNGNVWSGVDEGDVLTDGCINGWVKSIEEIAATAGVGTCTIVKTRTDSDYADHWRYSCSECGYQIEVGERDIATGNPTSHANFCWNCGRRIIEEETE